MLCEDVNRCVRSIVAKSMQYASGIQSVQVLREDRIQRLVALYTFFVDDVQAEAGRIKEANRKGRWCKWKMTKRIR